MTSCGKCICLRSKITPSKYCTYYNEASELLTEQRTCKSAGLFVGAVIWSSSGFQLGSSVKTRSIEVCPLNWFALEKAKSYNTQFITRKVVQYGCIFTHQIYFFSPKRFEKIKLIRKNTQPYYTTFRIITSSYFSDQNDVINKRRTFAFAVLTELLPSENWFLSEQDK